MLSYLRGEEGEKHRVPADEAKYQVAEVLPGGEPLQILREDYVPREVDPAPTSLAPDAEGRDCGSGARLGPQERHERLRLPRRGGDHGHKEGAKQCSHSVNFSVSPPSKSMQDSQLETSLSF